MRCKNCGFILHNTNSFCLKCGTDIEFDQKTKTLKIGIEVKILLAVLIAFLLLVVSVVLLTVPIMRWRINGIDNFDKYYRITESKGAYDFKKYSSEFKQAADRILSSASEEDILLIETYCLSNNNEYSQLLLANSLVANHIQLDADQLLNSLKARYGLKEPTALLINSCDLYSLEKSLVKNYSQNSNEDNSYIFYNLKSQNISLPHLSADTIADISELFDTIGKFEGSISDGEELLNKLNTNISAMETKLNDSLNRMNNIRKFYVSGSTDADEYEIVFSNGQHAILKCFYTTFTTTGYAASPLIEAGLKSVTLNNGFEQNWNYYFEDIPVSKDEIIELQDQITVYKNDIETVNSDLALAKSTINEAYSSIQNKINAIS